LQASDFNVATQTSVRFDGPRQRLAILGATGSVGASTLDVVGRHPERFEVIALTAHAQDERLLAECRRFAPRYAVLSSPMMLTFPAIIVLPA